MESGELPPSETMSNPEVEQGAEGAELQTGPEDQATATRLATDDDPRKDDDISEEDHSESGPEESELKAGHPSPKSKVRRKIQEQRAQVLARQTSEAKNIAQTKKAEETRARKDKHDLQVETAQGKKKATERQQVATAKEARTLKKAMEKANATWAAPSFTGTTMQLRSSVPQAAPEAAEASSSSVTSSESDAQLSTQDNPHVPVEEDDSDEDEEEALYETHMPSLIPDTDDEDDEDDSSHKNDAREPQEHTQPTPPELDKARNIAIEQIFKEMNTNDQPPG